MSAAVLSGAYGEGPDSYASHQYTADDVAAAAVPVPAPASPDLRPTLLVTTVDIGEGRSGRIELRLGDDPVDVARAFCACHGLPDSIVVPLAQHLEDNLAETASQGQAGEQEEDEEAEAAEGHHAQCGYGGEDVGPHEELLQQEPAPEEFAMAASRQASSIGEPPVRPSTAQRSRTASLEAVRAAVAQAEAEQATYQDAGMNLPAVPVTEGHVGRGSASGQSAAGSSSRPRSQHQAESSLPRAGSLDTHSPADCSTDVQPLPPPQQPTGQGMELPVAAAQGDAATTATTTPAAAAATSAAQQPLSYRPACITSSRGAEYYNQPLCSGRSVQSDGMPYSTAVGSGYGATSTGGGGSQLPAHSRLYADHFRKQRRLEEERRMRDLELKLMMEQVHIAKGSNKLAQNRTTGSYRNYGERLYVEGRLEAMKKDQLAQRVREEEERAEVEQYSFQPEITKLAQMIRKTTGEEAAPYQRLYQRSCGTAKRQVGYGGAVSTAERMAAIRREQEEAEVKECSFQPQINAKSARMVEARQQILKESGMAGFEQLYHEGSRRRMKLEQLAQQKPEEATFKPRVNTSSVVLKKLMEGRQPEGSTDVATRLLERGRKYQEKLQRVQRMQDEQPRDPVTGQLLFTPKTHRPPQYERNPDGAPIGEYLYSIKAEWEEKAARLRDAKERRTQQNASSTFVNTRSEKMVDRLKQERFRAIFDYLRRGQPSPVLNLLEVVQEEVFMDTIDPEVRADVEYASRILAKAIAKRQAAEQAQDCATSATPESARGASYVQSICGELDSARFVSLMEEVIARTKGLTRQYLLPMPSGRQKFEEPSFRPCIDPRSQALAARLRPETLPTYEVLYKAAEELAAKREEIRRAAEAAKLKECLFHPVMVAQPRAKEGRAIKMASTLIQGTRPSDESEGDAEESIDVPGADAAVQAQLQLQQAVAELTSAEAHVAQADFAAAAAASQPASGASSARGDGAGWAQSSDNGGVEGGHSSSAERLHFDALERQINEALVRLSMSEEQVAASLFQHATVPSAAAAASGGTTGLPGGPSLEASGNCLDFRAICGTPSPDLCDPVPDAGNMAASSAAGFNLLDDDKDAVAGMGSLAHTNCSSVMWNEESAEHVVADVLEGGNSSAAVAGSALQHNGSGAAASMLQVGGGGGTAGTSTGHDCNSCNTSSGRASIGREYSGRSSRISIRMQASNGSGGGDSFVIGSGGSSRIAPGLQHDGSSGGGSCLPVVPEGKGGAGIAPQRGSSSGFGDASMQEHRSDSCRMPDVLDLLTGGCGMATGASTLQGNGSGNAFAVGAERSAAGASFSVLACGGSELAGLDLHALASTDLPEHEAGQEAPYVSCDIVSTSLYSADSGGHSGGQEGQSPAPTLPEAQPLPSCWGALEDAGAGSRSGAANADDMPPGSPELFMT